MARRGLGDEATAGAIHKLNAVPSSSSAGEDKAKTAALALAAGTLQIREDIHGTEQT